MQNGSAIRQAFTGTPLKGNTLSENDLLTLVARSLDTLAGGKGNVVETEFGGTKAAWDAIDAIAKRTGVKWRRPTEAEYADEIRRNAESRGLSEKEFVGRYTVNGWFKGDTGEVVVAPGTSPIFAAGHEFLHHLRLVDPAGYDALIMDLSASMGKEESAELEKVRKIYDGTSADAEEEYWCNRFGELLQDPEKLRRFSLEMEMKNAGMTRRILIRIREYIRSILDAMGGKDTLQERRLKRADEMVGKILDNLERKIGAETTAGDGIAKYSISGLYTGSSADYDRPSLHYVGTGEGSQVYGWGLYASSERGVAESYLPPKDKIERANQYREYLKRRIAEETDPHEKGFLEFNLREAEKARTTQSVYEQTFFTDRPDGDESHLLKWYEPVSEENLERIRNQFSAEGLDKEFGSMYWLKYNGMSKFLEQNDIFGALLDNGTSGDAVYETLSLIVGGPKAASEFLARAGIDGVKYPVGSFNGPVRDGDEVGWNYVSFRDDNIRVDHKWVDGEKKFSVSKVTPEQDAEYEVGKKDDAGDVIPLSKRFKTRNYDPRYSVTVNRLKESGKWDNVIKNLSSSEDIDVRQAMPIYSADQRKQILLSYAGKSITNRDRNIPAQINKN